jgi:hypothetical protein
MLGGLFPESIFGRKLNPNAERRLRLSQARAEETIIRAHVDNALMFVDTLAEDLSFDRAIDTYIRVMGIPEPLASTVATRALVSLGRDLVPFRRRAREEGQEDEEVKPRLRLDDAAARARSIKRPYIHTKKNASPDTCRATRIFLFSRYLGVATFWGNPLNAAWSVFPRAPKMFEPQQYAFPSLPTPQLLREPVETEVNVTPAGRSP